MMRQDQEDNAASISYPALFYRWLDEQGYDVDEIFASAGIDTEWFDDPEKRISTQHFVAVTQKGFEVTGDAALGLHFGSQIPLSAHGYLGFALQASKNGEDVVRLGSAYGSSRFSGAQVELVETKRNLEVVVTSTFDDPALYRYTLEVYIASIVSAQKVLDRMNAVDRREDKRGPNGGGVLRRIQFDYPKPEYDHVYEDVFPNIKLEFDAEVTKVILDLKKLRQPFSFSDPTSRQLAVEQCQAELLALRTNETYADKVRRLITKNLSRSDSVERVAAQLNMSARVLSRRLQEEETSFQDLLDDVRKQLAVKYLKTTKLTVSEIAYRLNYEHPNNFARAFKKWTQKSPSDYR